MDWLIWAGAAVSLVGLGGLIASIRKVAAAKRAGLGDEALKAAIQSVAALHLGALFLSVAGLMMVVVGILLG